MSSEYPGTGHFENVATDRVIEEPWVVSMARPGERILDVGSATSRYLRKLAQGCSVYALDLRPTRPQPGVEVVRGDLAAAPFRPASFDTITCISTIEHVGLDIYGQGPDEFGDEVATRHLRLLLRRGGRLLLTAPFGERAVFAWHRVYDRASFRRLTTGYRALSIKYYRRDGDRYVACRRSEIEHAPFDMINMRSDGVVLAELTPTGGLAFLLGRLSLRLRRFWQRATRRGPYWKDPWSGEPATDWLKRQQARQSGRDQGEEERKRPPGRGPEAEQ